MTEYELFSSYGYDVDEDGVLYSTRSGARKVMHPYKTAAGYLRLDGSFCGQRVRIDVHRLVASKYLPNPNNLPQVNHIDGDKTNNNVSNLEWCSCSENVQHAWDTGLSTVNSGAYIAKAVLCVELDIVFESVSEAERITGVHNPNIVKVCKGHRHTAGGYHWRYV